MQRSKQILDNAREGAVLLSFGSIADTKGMGREMRGNILRAFARFPSVQFLWKLDSESRQNDSALFASAPNVHTFDWIRQSAILSECLCSTQTINYRCCSAQNIPTCVPSSRIVAKTV